MHFHPSKNTKVALILFIVVAIATFAYIQSFARSPSTINATSGIEGTERSSNVLPTAIEEQSAAGVNPTPADKLDSHVSTDGTLSIEFPQSWQVEQAEGTMYQSGQYGPLIDSFILENSSLTSSSVASSAAALPEGAIRIRFQIHEASEPLEISELLDNCADEDNECDTVQFNGVEFQRDIEINSRQQPTITMATRQNNNIYIVVAELFSTEPALMEEMNTVLNSIVISAE